MNYKGENAIAILLFGVGTVSCLAYAIYQYFSLLLSKDKINYTNATVTDTTTVVAETMKINNLKLAYVEYWVDGNVYTSSKRVQVPMNISEGDEIKIAYFKDNPSMVFTQNLNKANIFLLIGLLCLGVLIYLKGKNSL